MTTQMKNKPLIPWADVFADWSFRENYHSITEYYCKNHGIRKDGFHLDIYTGKNGNPFTHYRIFGVAKRLDWVSSETNPKQVEIWVYEARVCLYYVRFGICVWVTNFNYRGWIKDKIGSITKVLSKPTFSTRLPQKYKEFCHSISYRK